MKTTLGIFCLSLSSLAFSQGGSDMRGPTNVLNGGVIDGVVLADELPIRSKIEYEYVRSADYVWSKRVFSRIDSRELINQSLFLPIDIFSDTYDPLTPQTSVNSGGTGSTVQKDESWLRNSNRWALWTIIRQHILSGDLTIYRPSSKVNSDIEDGYSLKYPIEKKDYYSDAAYRNEVNEFLSLVAPNAPVTFPDYNTGLPKTFVKDSQTKLSDMVNEDGNQLFKEAYDKNPTMYEGYWNSAADGSEITEPGRSKWIASNSVKAYYIKEDWFFDKERSILDKRIIAIAPVLNYQAKVGNTARLLPIIYNELNEPLSKTTTVDPNTSQMVVNFGPYSGLMEERELFWLYFPELRNVIVNYFVYNDQNDAQWMSMDDLFWKRKYISTIYKVSDKFDREIQDYKYGVDALYEAEKIKEEIRTWEHDVWNF